MKKKIVSMLLCLTLAASMFAGCGNKSNNETKSDSEMFTFVVSGESGNTLNPVMAGDRWGMMICHTVYASPYFINPDGSVDYILAESMEAAEDGMSYTMTLKEGLKWSDGESITADDIIFSYNAINEASNAFYVNGEPIEFEKKDDKTVIFKLPTVSASAFSLLGSEVSILPKHIFEGKKSFDINMLEDEIVGCGPYLFEEYKTGEYIKFIKNPEYANGEADIDTLVYRVIEDADTASLALQNGEVDAMIATPDQLDTFEDNEEFNVINYSEGRVAYLKLNRMSDNLKDQKYREGLFYALNRTEILTAAYTSEDFFELGYTFLPPTNGYYTEDVEKYEQDVEKAKELTANGAKTLKLCYVEDDALQKNQGLVIQSELKEIGIDLELVPMNQAAYISVYLDKENKDYDIFLNGYVCGTDPDTYASSFVTTTDNYLNFDSEEIDGLFDQGRATLDENERASIYKEAQKVVSESGLFYPLGTNLRSLVLSSKVGNVEEAKLVPVYTFGDLSKLTIK